MDNELTKQGIFNTVVTHFKTQKVRAVEDGACSYRTSDGLSCAVGCLLEDNECLPSMENESVAGLIENGQFPSRLIPFAEILEQLQVIHDTHWNTKPLLRKESATELKRLAIQNGLNADLVDW